MGTITGKEGSQFFPANENDVYVGIETLASQKITSLQSANKLVDACYDYVVENGKVIEEGVIKMAESQAFDKNTVSFAAKDPSLYFKYFNNFEPRQFQTTIRRDDIRAILANKGEGLEGVVAKIIDTLTQGEGNEDFVKTRDLLYSANFKNYKSIYGGVPSNMKGVVHALREMYNHVKANNDDLTSEQYVSACPEEDIRIAISEKLMNLIDVKELASIFNLEKEQIFGKMVIVDTSDLSNNVFDYFAYVYDKKSLGRATRVYDFTQDVIGKTRYTNEYLTVERAYFHNGLFKGCYLDCTEAAVADKATIIKTPTAYTITKTLTNATTTSTVSSVDQNEKYEAVFAAASGYTLEGATVSITMGGSDIKASAWDEESGIVSIDHVKGNVVITISAVQE